MDKEEVPAYNPAFTSLDGAIVFLQCVNEIKWSKSIILPGCPFPGHLVRERTLSVVAIFHLFGVLLVCTVGGFWLLASSAVSLGCMKQEGNGANSPLYCSSGPEGSSQSSTFCLSLTVLLCLFYI